MSDNNNLEIERKFLIAELPDNLSSFPSYGIQQAYLNREPVVRIRKKSKASGDSFILTIKGEGKLARTESELPLTAEAYQHLLAKADGRVITKTRHLIPYTEGGHEFTIELDVFCGDLAPLIMAEVEFSSLEQAASFVGPAWFAEDVTADARYHNVNMIYGQTQSGYLHFKAQDAAKALSHRPRNSHKGDYGYVTLLGGCELYAGAVKLANLACSAALAGADDSPACETAASLATLAAASARSGAGVVRLAAPASLAHSVSPYLLESTFYPMAEEDGHLAFDEAELSVLIHHQRAIAFGMGVGRSADIGRILAYLLNQPDLTLIIDADGLYALATADGLLDQLKVRPASTKVILTPHPLEFARLTGLTVDEIQSAPIEHAKAFAAEHNVTLLLKGSTTIITDGTTVNLSDTGCAGMATAGSGDVLSGVILAMAGYIPDPVLAATTAAYVTGLAGELAQADSNPVSLIASDTAHYLERAITRVMKNQV